MEVILYRKVFVLFVLYFVICYYKAEGDGKVNKNEVLEYLVKETGVNRNDTEKVYTAIFDLIKNQLAKGENINIFGLGTFRIGDRKARKGIKPSTGEIIEIAPRRAVTFKPSPSLKKLVNDKKSEK